MWVYFLQHVEQRLGVPGNAEPQLGASILPHKLPKISASPPPLSPDHPHRSRSQGMTPAQRCRYIRFLFGIKRLIFIWILPRHTKLSAAIPD